MINNLHSDIRNSFSVLFVFFILCFYTACSNPWYKPYGIESDKELFEVSSVPKIVSALDDDNPSIRLMAVVALRKIGYGAREAIPALSKTAKDPHRNVRNHAIETLREMSLYDEKNANASLPSLLELLQDQNANLRLHAVETLSQIAVKFPETKKQVLSPLKNAMDDVHPNVSITALRAVNQLDPGSNKAKSTFKRLFSSHDASTRRNAILELHEDMFPKNTFYPFLDHMANHDPRATVRRDALIYLKWGNETERTPEIAAGREPYFDLAESAKGYVQFNIFFTKEKFPVSVSAKKWIETYTVLPFIQAGTPMAERPGKYRYSIYVGESDPKEVALDIEAGKLTECTISVTLKSTDMSYNLDKTILTTTYSFESAFFIAPPVPFSQ